MSPDWAQLPEGCRHLIVRHMDSTTRAAWRTVCKLACQDVAAATHRLTWRSQKQAIDLPLPSSSDLDWHPTTLPAALLAGLPSLRHLHFTNNGYLHCTEFLTSIQGIPATLRSLKLSDCPGIESLAPLQVCTALQQFTLTAYDGVSDDLLSTLPPALAAVSSTLVKLKLGIHVPSSSTAAESVVRSLAPLTRLQELSFCIHPKDYAHWPVLADMVGRMTDLRVLDLSNDNTDDYDCDDVPENDGDNTMCALVPAIGQLPSLQSLNFSNSGKDTDEEPSRVLAGAVALLSAPLTSLNMGSFTFDTDNAPVLVTALHAHAATLRSVNLSFAILNSDVLASIAPGLQCCSALTDLDLSYCLNGSATVPAGTALAAAVSGCAPSLTSLNLSDYPLSKGQAAVFAPELARMTALTALWLSGCYMGCDGMNALAPSLCHLTSLVQLHCRDCGVGSAGATALASALPSMVHLRELDLVGNTFGFQGLRVVVGGLQALSMRAEGGAERAGGRANQLGLPGTASDVLQEQSVTGHWVINAHPLVDRRVMIHNPLSRYVEEILSLIKRALKCLRGWEKCTPQLLRTLSATGVPVVRLSVTVELWEWSLTSDGKPCRRTLQGSASP